MTSRALPRLDEDDRLTPILTHLSQNFTTPDAHYSSSATSLPGADISARNVDTLSSSFPLCMQNLHRSLRRDAHLKHFGRLQYTLFLKGIGLNLEECLIFWRSSFSKITDDVFNKEYRYNVRHTYGDVGGDSNRRGGGYSPFSCQKILIICFFPLLIFLWKGRELRALTPKLLFWVPGTTQTLVPIRT